MLGTIIGDIVGSRFEFNPDKNWKGDKPFHPTCHITDDTVCTIAIMDTLLTLGLPTYCSKNNYIKNYIGILKKHCNRFPASFVSYGTKFLQWLEDEDSKPYGSYGNGAAMRIAPVAYACYCNKLSIQETLDVVDLFTGITHNSREGIKGARCTAHIIYQLLDYEDYDTLLRTAGTYYPEILSMSYDDIKPDYTFDETCQGTVPQAIICALEGNGFMDTIIKAVSLGGDADTLAAIAGAMAEADHGITGRYIKQALQYLPDYYADILFEFYEIFKR